MPEPSGRVIPPEAGYPGLPINDEQPSLRLGFVYQNEVARPRREFYPDIGENGEWRKLEFGKPGGSLYPVWASTPWDLKEFGLGVAMYFQTLQLLTITFTLTALFQSQTIYYYRSAQYSDRQIGVPALLKGSAVCTRRDTVCIGRDCLETSKANLCHMSQLQAWVDLSNTVVLLIQMIIVSLVQNHVSVKLNESIQTAQDYSVLVDDPGAEDFDPDLWQEFFAQFGHVTFVTVAKDNGQLLAALAGRRAVMREIIMIIGNGTPGEDTSDGVIGTTWDGMKFGDKLRDAVSRKNEPTDDKSAKGRKCVEMIGIFGMKSIDKWVKDLAKANEKIQVALDKAIEKPYIASKVFVTFETELGQRRCLQALSQGTITAAFDLSKARMKPEHIFKGENVLAVKEACEPQNVFWCDVDVTFKTRFKQQSLTFLFTFMLIIGSVFACKRLQLAVGAGGAALWISLTNILVPIVIRQLTFSVETHVSMNDQQLSLFMKLSFFRWANTAIVLFLITDFDDFLTAKAMEQVQAVLIADAITTPLIRTLNPMDLINQLIVSNVAITQEKMNTYFFGAIWFPAERYADMTKTLFLALFYSALLPSGLFLTAFSYAFTYTVDKYSVLRSWRTPAELDDEITRVSRGHMIFAVYCHAVMTMIFYAEFPFDNVCVPKNAHIFNAKEYHRVKMLYNVTTPTVYEACDQTVTGRVVAIFAGGSMERDTMYGKQRRVVKVYAYLVMVLTVFIFILFFGSGIVCGCYHLFHGSYKYDSDANLTQFSTTDIQAFIPNIPHPSLDFPLIACRIDTFESKYLPFELPEEELYAKQCLYNHAELPGLSEEEFVKLFSEIKFYPPPSDYKDAEEEPKK